MLKRLDGMEDRMKKVEEGVAIIAKNQAATTSSENDE
jgi:hypothetical protein